MALYCAAAKVVRALGTAGFAQEWVWGKVGPTDHGNNSSHCTQRKSEGEV